MDPILRKGVITLTLAAAAFSLCGCKGAEGKEERKGTTPAAADTANAPGADTAATAEGQLRVACLIAGVNVRETPGTGGRVVGVFQRGEEAVVVGEDPEWFAESAGGTPVDGYGWFKVRLTGGATGYVAAPFVAPAKEYEALAAVDAAARGGDAAATKAAIEKFIREAFGEDDEAAYEAAAEGRKFLVPYPHPKTPSGPLYLVSLGSGICGRVIATSWECSHDGSYVATALGGCVNKRLAVYEWSSARLRRDCSVWQGGYEFLPEANVLVWVEGLRAHPEPYELAGGIRVDPAALPPFGREAHPCVFAHDFDVPTTFLVAGPDANTLHKMAEGGTEYVTLRPEALFTSHPLFPYVAASRTYSEWVGPEVYAYCSEE
ncbi:MAG: SH3 domain-containing protein [Candidatus Zixiibacteriota bacterium]